jgi:hypothetical protein
MRLSRGRCSHLSPGINNAGQIIGTYLHQRPGSNDLNDYDSEIAFLYDNDSFTALDFPGAKAPFLCCGATTLPMDIKMSVR